jgi:hypothetical protein
VRRSSELARHSCQKLLRDLGPRGLGFLLGRFLNLRSGCGFGEGVQFWIRNNWFWNGSWVSGVPVSVFPFPRTPLWYAFGNPGLPAPASTAISSYALDHVVLWCQYYRSGTKGPIIFGSIVPTISKRTAGGQVTLGGGGEGGGDSPAPLLEAVLGPTTRYVINHLEESGQSSSGPGQQLLATLTHISHSTPLTH